MPKRDLPKRDLQKRIDELERRVKELEERPPIVINNPTPLIPVMPCPIPEPSPVRPWWLEVWCTNGTGPRS